MKPEIRQRLLEELASGKWRKARGQLVREGNRRCCLGVLCEMYEAEGNNLYMEGDETLPPQEVRAWAGFTSGVSEVRRLANANDLKAGWPIAEIEALDST